MTISSNNNSSTSDVNSCMDITDPGSTKDPISCQGQLCYVSDFLHLPAPGVGKINRNSSSNCLIGDHFSLFGPSLPSGDSSGNTNEYGDGLRYTQSCVAQFPGLRKSSTTCKKWEYAIQGSCFLHTCGPGMDCQSPYVCRKTKAASTNPILYGLCMNPRSQVDPGDNEGNVDDDRNNAHAWGKRDDLLIGLLVGISVDTGCWQFRKRRLQQLTLLNGETDHRTLSQKITFWTETRCLFTYCCFCSRRVVLML
ncbi:hypothetical protein BX616_005658 [Lobosporangium transversale]|uniref:Uncharacterized protein n=1 Tax=Lobosporangium transversale TaxID=64571 RepID=A0A1Y2GRN5_9FUNG|nr:hypothetical protein BCR41DRAFT_36459 [Lobosporangium transversale]KAF9897405.1 hypothetical protein BX616_005658 [Lobosporangium transversale]ORZ20142.1 hypothetical protein BCR41DRAFT_36459 [Lobosporangium transversale]|eukprot:XP_021882682.1 hypothetical protein BCR41DRAFT_36459 [Lobosporangium transversale]